MAIYTLQPTVNTTPNIGGDGAVTGASNTGHAQTTCIATGEPNVSDDRSCRWSGFPAGPSNKLSATLKVTHTSSGVLSGATALNSFNLEYSLNGGGAWNSIVSRSNYTASQGPTVASVALSVAQDLTQVQVRDRGATFTNAIGDEARAIFTISDIKIEVLTQDQVIVMM